MCYYILITPQPTLKTELCLLTCFNRHINFTAIRLGDGVNFPLCCLPCLYNIYVRGSLHLWKRGVGYVFTMAPTHANYRRSASTRQKHERTDKLRSKATRTLCSFVAAWHIQQSGIDLLRVPWNKVTVWSTQTHTHTHTPECVSLSKRNSLAMIDLKQGK